MTWISSNGLQLPFAPARPRKSIYIAGPKIPLAVVVDDASTKTGDVVKMKVSTYANGVEDDGAESVSSIAVMDIPALPTNSDNAYPYDYTFEAAEEAEALLLVPGLIHWARCADNTGAIAIGDTLETAAGGLLTEAHASTATAAGHAAHWMALTLRAQSATESWIVVMYLGRGYAAAAG